MKNIRETSAIAYRTIKENGLLSARRFQVYKTLYSAGAATAGEICELMRRQLNFKFNATANVSARLNELREMNCVREIGQRACQMTGQEVLVWQVTDKLPGLLIKRETKNEIIARLEKKIKILEQQLFEASFQ